jgi:transposase
MRKTREVLRLSAAGQSNRMIAKGLGMARSTVAECLARARAAGVSWPLPPECTDADLEALLYPAPKPSTVVRPLPDWADVHREMKKRKQTGVTLQLLWIEYKEREPEGLQYSQFCEIYRRWRKHLDPVLRQDHVPGEKVFVDYAGQTVPVIDRETGEVREAQIFVGVLGASNFTYAEATWSQQLPEWIGSHVRMLEYFGGVPRLIVPDNLRGRVMGVYVFMFLGMSPIGAMQAGALARWLGAPVALTLGAAALLLVIAAVWLRVPELRALR